MRARLWVLGLVAIAVGGCSLSRSHVQVRAASPSATMQADGSRLTRETLRLLHLRWAPAQCESILRAIGDAPLPRPEQWYVLADLALEAVEEKSCPLPREPLLLGAARLTYSLLATEFEDDHLPPDEQVMALYNRIVAELLFSGGTTDPLTDRAAALDVAIEPASLEAARRFDRFIDADSLKVTGLLERHRRSGIGVALIGIIGSRPGEWRHARAYDGGYAQAMTALLHFDEDGAASLQLLDTSITGVIIGGRPFTLHVDFTAPYAWQLGHSRMRARESLGAFFPASAARHRGLLMLEPFDPDRIPVLMIHGFWSSPEAWRNITNELLATPELRSRFQIWHYFYPTGTSYLYSAGVLRQDLEGFFAELRAVHGDDAVRPMAVIGHSQGGLLARSLVINSGWALWDSVFRVPAHSLSTSPQTRAVLQRSLVFEPMPEIGTVVLMATPNSGIRSIRHSLRAFLVNAFTNLPDEAARALRTLRREHPEQLRDGVHRWFARGGLTALEAMAPDGALTPVFGRLPIHPQVRVHTIVAVNDHGDGDEFVTRDSAHVERAASELTILADHRDIDEVAVLAQLRVILGLHALD